MKYLKRYYIFNEANFSTESNLEPEEKQFLDKVKKERPHEYNKYLTYVKSKSKGLWYAINKYSEGDPKRIKEKQRLDKQAEKSSIIVKNRDHVRNLIPKLEEIDKIYLDKFQKPYDDFWNYFYGKSCPFNFFNKQKSRYENQWEEHVLKCEGRYANTKRASCNIHSDGSYIMTNTPEEMVRFLSEYLERNKCSLSKSRLTKPFHLFSENNDFQSFGSDFRMYIHASRYAVSVEINFNITFGVSLAKYNEPIFKTIKKTGNLKRGADYTNKPEITQQDVINCINDALDEIVSEMNKKKDLAKFNMENLILNLISDSTRSSSFIKLAKESTPLYKKMLQMNGADDLDKAMDLDYMGFND